MSATTKIQIKDIAREFTYKTFTCSIVYAIKSIVLHEGTVFQYKINLNVRLFDCLCL